MRTKEERKALLETVDENYPFCIECDAEKVGNCSICGEPTCAWHAHCVGINPPRFLCIRCQHKISHPDDMTVY